MGHIAYDASFKKSVGGPTFPLTASIMKSKDQFRVAFGYRLKFYRERALDEQILNLVCLHISWARWRKPVSFVAKVMLGPGAGYCFPLRLKRFPKFRICGRTLFLGVNCKGGRVWGTSERAQRRQYDAMYRGERFRLGLTMNANKVPYPNW